MCNFGDWPHLWYKKHPRTQVVDSLEQKRSFFHNYVVMLYHNLAAKFGFYWQPDDIFDIFKGPGDPCHWPEVPTT